MHRQMQNQTTLANERKDNLPKAPQSLNFVLQELLTRNNDNKFISYTQQNI